MSAVYYVNPYTGEVRPVVSTRTHDFMHLMEEWHRFLSLSGDRRPLGKAITGACNLAFLFLALSGLYHATASTQAVIHPFTGEFLQREGYADQTAGRQARSWLRYLHTGQAFGWFGQLVAGLACAGGLVLVYTGFALSWRRFFTRKA